MSILINKKLLIPISSALLFSFNGVITKMVYRNFPVVSSEIFFFFISLFSTIVTAGFLFIRNKTEKVFEVSWKDLLVSGAITGFSYFLIDIFSYYSLAHISVALQRMILSSKLFVIIFIDFLILGKKMSGKSLIVVILISVGLFMIIGKVNFASDRNLFKGICFATASTLISVFYTYLFKHISDGINATVFSLYITFFSSISSLTMIYFRGQVPALCSVLMNYKLLFILLLASFPIHILSSPLYFLSLEKVGVFPTTACGRIGPALSILWSYLILGEKLTGKQIIGCSMVIGASILNLFDKKKDSTQKKNKN